MRTYISKIFHLYITVIFIFILTAAKPVNAQTLSKKLSEDIEDNQLDDFSHIEAAFIISGADTKIKLDQGILWFRNLLDDIRTKNLIGYEKIPSAEKLFIYFHTTWLKKYQEKATTLFDIIDRKEFNCVAATVLYNLTCDELGLSTNAFETPTHVYTIFSNIAERVMVENTTSMGFNILKNLKSYSKYLQQYYPQQQALQIGLDKLYFYENSKGREINNTELLGLICYNLALFHSENKVYEKAYQYVELAQSFNQDSRSNATFEQHLYYKWGKQLYDQKKFYQAFEVIADAYYRYPENSDFKNNCLVMFIKALDNLYLIKDWEKSENIILEMDELNIRTRREVIHQKKILTDWANYFYLNQRKKQAERATELFHDTK